MNKTVVMYTFLVLQLDIRFSEKIVISKIIQMDYMWPMYKMTRASLNGEFLRDKRKQKKREKKSKNYASI